MNGRYGESAIDLGFLEQAATRVRYLLLAFAGGFIVVYLLPPLLRGEQNDAFSRPVGRAPGVLSIAAALIVWGLTPILKARPQRVLNFGLTSESWGEMDIPPRPSAGRIVRFPGSWKI